MSFEYFILGNKSDTIIGWIKLPRAINLKKTNLVQIQDFFGQNKVNIANSLNKLEIWQINFIFSLMSFHVRSYNPADHINNDIYLAKFFLFEFFCNYLSDSSEKEDFLNKNFIPIMQQALLNKSNNYNEKNYYDVIIDVITKYFLKNRNISFKTILPMISKSVNEKNFLGLFDSTDLQKKIIRPAIIQEKIANYLFSYSFDTMNYLNPENQGRNSRKITKEPANISSSDIKKVDSVTKSLDKEYFCWLSISDDVIYDVFIAHDTAKYKTNILRKNLKQKDFVQNSIFDNLTLSERFRASKQFYTNKLEESMKLMEKIVSIAERRALKFLESSENKINVVTETSEISGPDSTPKISTDQLNPTENLDKSVLENS